MKTPARILTLFMAVILLTGLLAMPAAAQSAVGKTVTFGSYEQDGEAGSEPIEWIILEVEGERVLLLSKYALDAQQFHTSLPQSEWQAVYWSKQDCGLRNWLEGEFLQAAFSESEQSSLIEITVQHDSDEFVEKSGDINGRVFLLSASELSKYGRELGSAVNDCYPTTAAAAKLYKYTSGETCRWWLRTMDSITNAMYAISGGKTGVQKVYNSDNRLYCAVRPAVWVELAALL